MHLCLLSSVVVCSKIAGDVAARPKKLLETFMSYVYQEGPKLFYEKTTKSTKISRKDMGIWDVVKDKNEGEIK